MSKPQAKYQLPTFTKPLLVIVGGYGSGKSEVAVNLARMLVATSERPVSIADLDIVNPYFRSREASQQLKALGITNLIPAGENVHADLPIVIPQIKGAVQSLTGTAILDVGGDDVGARILSSLADAFQPETYEMLLVLNANRPFTADVASTLALMEKIEVASRLSFTGIISNTHLMEQTSVDDVSRGLALATEVSRRRKIPVVFLSTMKEIIEHMDPQQVTVPVLTLTRSLLKPWERPT